MTRTKQAAGVNAVQDPMARALAGTEMSMGQKLSFNVLNPTFGSCNLTVYDPNGTGVAFGPCSTGTSNYIDTVTLGVTGTYKVVVDPQGAATGSVSVSINNGSDVTGTIVIDGAAVTATTTVAGQDARL